MYFWRELGVNSWPTFSIVGPNGKLLAQISGEGHRKVLSHSLTCVKIEFGDKFYSKKMVKLFSKKIFTELYLTAFLLQYVVLVISNRNMVIMLIK